MSAESKPHSELAEKVRKGLNPRGHHRLCRVNMPTDWSSECNCPHDEVEDGHAALDGLQEQLEALELENARLKNALRRIADAPGKNATVTGAVARAALAFSPASEPKGDRGNH